MTLIIVIVSSLISIACFYNRGLFELLDLQPYRVIKYREYWRVVTHALVHANWLHLIINMIVLYSFGQGIEYYFRKLSYEGILRFHSNLYYITLYLSAIVVSSITTIQKYKNYIGYHAVGASGAVSAVLFACIFFSPWQKLFLWAIIPIPGFVFGVLYLWYSHYMGRRAGDSINHEAHFWGALYGLSFPIILYPPLLYFFIKSLLTFNL